MRPPQSYFELAKVVEAWPKRRTSDLGGPVDTKKKELVEDFKNRGREWLPKGEPH